MAKDIFKKLEVRPNKLDEIRVRVASCDIDPTVCDNRVEKHRGISEEPVD